MATLKQRLHRKNSSGTYDIVHLETSSDAVIMSDGSTTLTSKISTMDTNISGKLSTSGTAASATKLATARTIQTNLASTSSASFDGSANITPGVNGTLPIANGGTGNTIGLAASATKLATARTIQTDLASTSTASFDGSANVTPGVTGTLPLGNGGTGATTAAAALYALINGSSALTSSTLATGDSIALLDASASTGKRITIANLISFIKTNVSLLALKILYGTESSGSVTFSSAFSSTPVVVISPISDRYAYSTAVITSVSTSGFSWYGGRLPEGSNQSWERTYPTIYYIAIGT